MNISDGFSLWIGKALAELALAFTVILGFVAFAMIVSALAWLHRYWGRRQSAKASK